jgi:L-2-hydroxyglutarate oxidase LhgO
VAHGGKRWHYAIGEFHRSLSKSAFVGELQRLVPEVTESDVVPDGSGVRAQALRRDGLLVDDFECIIRGSWARKAHARQVTPRTVRVG